MVEQKPLKLVVGSPNTIAEMNSSTGDTLQEALLPSSVTRLTATQTLTNKTLTSPAINLIESKTATNATIVAFASTPVTAVGSACDHVKIINAASGGGALLQADNSGASDVDLNLAGKGLGIVKAGGSAVVTAASTTTMINKTLNSPLIVTPSISSTGFASANHGHTDGDSGGRLSGAAISSSVRGIALHSGSAPAIIPTASSFKTASSGGLINNYTGAVPALSYFSSGETTGAFGGQPYMTTRSRLSYLNHITTNLSTASTGFISFGPLWRISGPSSANDQELAGHYTNWRGPAAVSGGPYETQYYACNTVGSSTVLNAAGAGKMFEVCLAGRLISTGTATVWNIGVLLASTGAPSAIPALSTASIAAGNYMVSVSFWVSITTTGAFMCVIKDAQFINTSTGAAQALTGSVFAVLTGVNPDATARYLGIQIGNNTAMATGTPSFNGIIAGWEHN